MFQISVERLYPLFAPEQILVVANAELTPQLQKQAPDLPPQNFLIEPSGRDTAPAVGLGAIHVHHRDPNAVMAVLTADHHIADVRMFRKVLKVALEEAKQGEIITLGIEPTHPSIGFGYIERGTLLKTTDDIEIYSLARFAEKPNRETAEQFLASGDYSWNSGMFIWPASRVLAEFAQHAADMHERLKTIASSIGTPGYDSTLAQEWQQIRKVSVDYALMEHVEQHARVIPIDIGWSDIGNFEALYAILSDEQGDNVAVGPNPLLLETTGTILYTNRFVATIGVDDLIIVDTDDVLLVSRRDQAQKIKQVVERLREHGQDAYL
jgi:mannose-1-phosphate guanylyltransferase